MLNNRSSFQKKRSKHYLLYFLVFAALTTLISGIFSIQLKKETYNNIDARIKESSHLNAALVHSNIYSIVEKLNVLGMTIDESMLADPQALSNRLTKLLPYHDAKNLGVMRQDGTMIISKGGGIDLSLPQNCDFLKEALAGKVSVSNQMSDVVDGTPIIVFATPLQTNGGRSGALFASISVDEFERILSISLFDEEAYNYVIKGDGMVVITQRHANYWPIVNFFNDIRNRSGESGLEQEARNNILNNRPGFIRYASRYVYYEPLGINNWHLLTMLPTEIIDKEVKSILYVAYLAIGLCWFLIITLGWHIYRAQERYLQELRRIVMQDAVTGYPSYESFKEEVNKILASDSEQAHAIVYLSIRHLKYINDLYGFDEGRWLLKVISRSIAEHLQEDERAARLDSDGFVLCLECYSQKEMERRLRLLIEDIQNYTTKAVKQVEYHVKMFAGIYIADTDDTISLESMVDRAELALRENVANGIVFAYYDADIRDRIFRRKEIEDLAENAFVLKEFQVYFQPQYDLNTGCFYGAEALARWDSAQHGCISPKEFIPVLEGANMIVALDEYIFETVCQKIREWLDAGLNVTPISINVSRVHLYRANVVEKYLSIIRRYEVPIELIKIELTETALFDNEEILVNILNRFRAAGIQLLMDDFGSGYSSILMLNKFNFDIIKIDKGLIDTMLVSDKSRKILQSIVTLAQSLGFKTVAEGVEIKLQMDVLKEMQVDIIQGYFTAKPTNCENYIEYLKKPKCSF